MTKKLSLWFLFYHVPVLVFSQVITGIVFDQETHDTISFASVYLNGTFIGTHTNLQGRFSLDLTGKSSMPLTISAVGYYSAVVTDYKGTALIEVFLSPKVFEMEEVVIKAESLVKQREANLKIFKREFLGSSVYALGCRIENEKDITFNYYSDRDTLKAFASNPIRIYNRLLGYKIIYYMDQFVYGRNNADLMVRGSILFIEDLADSANRKKITKRRRHAYLGSAMHFFRTLWADDFKVSGFSVLGPEGYMDDRRVYKRFVTQQGNMKFLCCAENMSVMYGGKFTDVKILLDSVAFNKYGQYDYTRISWKGDMGNLRIGDWLPYEFEPYAKPKMAQKPVKVSRSRKKHADA